MTRDDAINRDAHLENLKSCFQNDELECEGGFIWEEGFNAGLECAIRKIEGADTVDADLLNVPLTLEELREMAKEKPVVVWVVCLYEDGTEDQYDGEWEMFFDNTFIGDSTWDNTENYGTLFVAYRCKPAEV